MLAGFLLACARETDLNSVTICSSQIGVRKKQLFSRRNSLAVALARLVGRKSTGSWLNLPNETILGGYDRTRA